MVRRSLIGGWTLVLILVTIGLMQAETQQQEESPFQEKCYTCHAEEPAFQQWKQSKHAQALTYLRTYPNRDDSCLSCHSSGAKQVRTSWRLPNRPRPTLETAVNEVSCSSCHLHSSKREHYLIRPPLSLCASCHQMDCGCAGKGIIHQSQTEMYMGRRGKGVLNQPSPHMGVVPGDCAGCHMTRLLAEVPAVDEAEEAPPTHGGHTFKASYEVCLQCHGNAIPRVEAAKERIGGLLERVNALLETLPDPTSEDYKTIQLHRDMVVKDGGYGVHNFAYAESLLRYALKLGGEAGE